MTVVTLKNATVKQKNRLLFNNLNFTIKKGQHWAIVGPAGSGKTTLLQILADRHFVSKGTITHHYYEAYRAKYQITDPLFSCRSLVSYVDVKHDFKTLSNTRDFFYQQRFNASYANVTQTVDTYLKEIADRAVVKGIWTIDRIYETFSLAQLRDKHLIKLSNGENKRLRIAAALLKNPFLLLLDHPLVGLDVAARHKFESIFREVALSGITLVMATSPEEIPDVITNVLVLNDVGTAEALPKSEFSPGNVSKRGEVLLLPEDKQMVTLLNGHKGGKRYKKLVSMKDVHISYGPVKVLEGINWEIRPGERWALTGPNGSGKSSLLGLIYGDHPQAYANDMVLFDRKRGSGESIWDIKRNIGFMSPELFQYFPGHFTCRQVVESGFSDGLALFKRVNVSQKQLAQRWMEVMGIADIQGQRLADVSTTRQRLCLLARALVKSPPLLILDEPCQNFGTSQKYFFRTLIDVIARLSNLSLIYVTHHREELPECIDKELRLR